MSNVNQKCFKFNVLAKPEFSEEYVRYVHAENKEQALKKLEFNFLGYEIEQAILVGVGTKKRGVIPRVHEDGKPYELHIIGGEVA